MMKLYDYFRSSAAYRVRIALNLKGLVYEQVAVNLRAKQQFEPAYARLNPQSLVPTLVDGDVTISQSLAIVEYLEEKFPNPPLLPAETAARARVRSLALTVACDIHPLNNSRPLEFLTDTLGLGEAAKMAWYRTWIARGFEALETRLSCEPATGRFCHGDSPTLADVCLVPQVKNARRYDCDIRPYPTVVRIEQECLGLEPFARAIPERQPDAT